jgi:2,4-dienoyl-CoA reductase-like NADH-dependent reductase (Old Yellow Enzyme family)
MSHLFSPLQIRGLTLKNRIAVSPMCQYSAVDGFANDWHLIHLGSRATGGAGLIISEAMAIAPEGRISPEDLGLWKDEHIEPLQHITNFIHQQGSVAAVQLAHAGHKASSQSPWNGGQYIQPKDGGWPTVSASKRPLLGEGCFSDELTLNQIQQIINNFVAAAQRALAAGFKIIEIHAAHGYLLHGFLSPLSNQRNDEYGRSFENRTRLLIQIVRKVRAILPQDMPLFVRISASDWDINGWQIGDSIRLSTQLKNEGVDLIDCSSGGLVAMSQIAIAPGYQVDFAQQIREKVTIKTAAVGMITKAEQANEIITNNKADLVLIARESLRNPNFPLQAAHQLGYDIAWPNQYTRAKL